VRPCLDGRGSSGTPFRQALEHPSQLLAGEDYVCLGAQPQSVSRHHWDYVHERGGTVRWFDGAPFPLREYFQKGISAHGRAQKNIYLTVDADAVRAADVPGVSAPNPVGLPGRDVGRMLAPGRIASFGVKPRPGRDQSASGSRRREARAGQPWPSGTS